MKYFLILFLEFLAAILGNLIANFLQQYLWSNRFPLMGLYGSIAGALIMLLLITGLESGWALPGIWRWHRYWYLAGISNNPKIQDVMNDFARLEAIQGPRKVSLAEIEIDYKRQDLVEVLMNFILERKSGCRIMVLGEPGSGKTTSLRRLTAELGKLGAKRVGQTVPIPVYVELGNFQSGRLFEYVAETMVDSIYSRNAKILGNQIDELIRKGNIVLLLDALDEALGSRKELVLAELGNILEHTGYEKTSIIVTTRTQEDPGQRLTMHQNLQIQPLNDEAVKVFIEIYKSSNENPAEIEDQLTQHGLLDKHGLGRNPFWLRQIVESGILKGEKGQILNKAIDSLLDREQTKPEAARSFSWVLPKREQLEKTKNGLAYLGYKLWIDKQVLCSCEKAEHELRNWLTCQVGLEKLRPQDILGLGRNAQILIYDPNIVQFHHRLLQDFMVAWAFAIDEQLQDQIQSLSLGDQDLYLIIELLAGLLKHENWRIRTGAINSLREMKCDEATKQIISSLNDENDQVVLEAIRALDEAYDERSIEPLVLLLKNSNEKIRVDAQSLLVKMGRCESLSNQTVGFLIKTLQRS